MDETILKQRLDESILLLSRAAGRLEGMMDYAQAHVPLLEDIDLFLDRCQRDEGPQA